MTISPRRTDEEICRFIISYRHVNGIGPTMANISDFCGYADPSGVLSRLRRMRTARLIDWLPRRKGTMRVLRHRYFIMDGEELREITP